MEQPAAIMVDSLKTEATLMSVFKQSFLNHLMQSICIIKTPFD